MSLATVAVPEIRELPKTESQTDRHHHRIAYTEAGEETEQIERSGVTRKVGVQS